MTGCSNSDAYGTITVPLSLFTANSRMQLSLASGFYYLTILNGNPTTIAFPIGTPVILGQLFNSPPASFASSFNNIKNSTEAVFQGNIVTIQSGGFYSHNITLQVKLEKKIGGDALNYINRRELRCYVSTVSDPSNAVDATTLAYIQPDASEHETIVINGSAQHSTGDELCLSFQVVQDADRGGQSDSQLTIFRVSWNIIYVGTE
jgi:hypothetical protein